MRMWGAGVIIAAGQAVTKDKMPVTDPFLSESDTWGTAPQAAGARSFSPGTAASSSRV